MTDKTAATEQAEKPAKEASKESAKDKSKANKLQQQIDDLSQQLAKSEIELKKVKEEALRVHAEMDNLRKRTEKQVADAYKFSVEKFASELLGVLDSLEHGLNAVDKETGEASLKEGMELTHKLLLDIFGRFNITPVNPEGEQFDPKFHEAISMIPTAEHKAGTVMNIVQKGYLLSDRLIRPARVVVAKEEG